MFRVDAFKSISLTWCNSKMTITRSSNLIFGRNTLETLNFICMACYLILSQHDIPGLDINEWFFFVQLLGRYFLAVFWVALQSIQYCWARTAKNMQIIACIWSGFGFQLFFPKKFLLMSRLTYPPQLKKWLALKGLDTAKIAQSWVRLHSRFYLEVQKATTPLLWTDFGQLVEATCHYRNREVIGINQQCFYEEHD